MLIPHRLLSIALILLFVISTDSVPAVAQTELLEAETENSPLATSGPQPRIVEPPAEGALQSAIDRGVDFLLQDQRPDGGWGSAEQTKGLNIYAPVPGAHQGFKLAVGGLVLSSLVECESTLDAERAAKVSKAIDRGTKWMLENHERVRRAEPMAIYNVWGHAYGLQSFVDLYHRAKLLGQDELEEKLLAAAQIQADKLNRYSFLSGGWGYYDFDHRTQVPASSPTSFTTATMLVALHNAKEIGVRFPEKLIDKAIASINRQRNPDFSYAYGEYLRMMPRMEINRPAGSLGRSQACNLALRLFGDEHVTDEVIQTWLDRLFARNNWLGYGRKLPIPHESYFMVAGYFYYYGHYYATMCIEQLPEEDRQDHENQMAHILLPLQEKDGSWWDYPFYNYHQQYGTAMALYSLRHCQQD
ncbi:prenyltransferase/squalene oxidase repeat-containing protein [Bythopirellula goksoeyrii]|uniref:Squalene cyclase C-terminal domain-containing protein n=1 Tax=Bythopirellula goksoeyrii TaxID=1400387 RepID=A0A5B9QI52_9BACT|nr:hypothetical protein [Bythopirellula goksoeyrii]QEG37639.1 hypothetical protein Pr1d_49850 [Bythopirellula goksoeyrii]